MFLDALAISRRARLHYTALMNRGLLQFLFLAFATLAVATAGARAQATAESPAETPSAETPAAPAAPSGVPPYEDRLLRLAEIIGSLQYLRNLCDPAGETEWRRSMEQLLDNETADEPGRRSKLTAGYNRGYRAFAAVHTTCSDAAIAAEARYRREGEALASEIVARYGN